MGAARVEAIKTGLSVAAGIGAVSALILAVRKQSHHEANSADTVTDATARRVTDIYTKAADQLSSDKPAVRIAGLYALERCAQDNPDQRETILNVLCAYLRMPTPTNPEPTIESTSEDHATHRQLLHDRVLEHQVRLTAQRILTRHRQADTDLYWAGPIDLTDADLTRAALLGTDLTGADLFGAKFTNARLANANLAGVDLTSVDLTGGRPHRRQARHPVCGLHLRPCPTW
ncbi:hypothetical protein UO65_5430 [Actinokineospora spheciospongiae]|uniref:Pentapeptide repeat family protein n=1 Tax=Actinokineospora spheciospongiae TaxID=909613 RepID=W7IG37_9PSEU|nr:pentapeptide repeat-containing protein [Actinokineospora spheciospongiae]EWC59273.1 hypothetical protein UO65_5430 [Actinokineospora spheciospongiae]